MGRPGWLLLALLPVLARPDPDGPRSGAEAAGLPPDSLLQRVLGPEACSEPHGLCFERLGWGMDAERLREALRAPTRAADCDAEYVIGPPGAGLSAVEEWRQAGRTWRPVGASARAAGRDWDDGPGAMLLCLDGGVGSGGFTNQAGLQPGKRFEVTAFGGGADRGLSAIGARYQWADDFDGPFFLERTVAALARRFGPPAVRREDRAVFRLEGPGERAQIFVWVDRLEPSGPEERPPLSLLRIDASVISVARAEAAVRADALDHGAAWREKTSAFLGGGGGDAELAGYALGIARRDLVKAPCSALGQLERARLVPGLAVAAQALWREALAGALARAEAARADQAAKRLADARRRRRKEEVQQLEREDAVWRAARQPAVRPAAAAASPRPPADRPVAWAGLAVQQLGRRSWLVHRADGPFILNLRDGAWTSGLQHLVATGYPGRERLYQPGGSALLPSLNGASVQASPADPGERCDLGP